MVRKRRVLLYVCMNLHWVALSISPHFIELTDSTDFIPTCHLYVYNLPALFGHGMGRMHSLSGAGLEPFQPYKSGTEVSSWSWAARAQDHGDAFAEQAPEDLCQTAHAGQERVVLALWEERGWPHLPSFRSHLPFGSIFHRWMGSNPPSSTDGSVQPVGSVPGQRL